MTLPAIRIPVLRPEVDGVAFPGTEVPPIPAAIAEVQPWID